MIVCYLSVTSPLYCPSCASESSRVSSQLPPLQNQSSDVSGSSNPGFRRSSCACTQTMDVRRTIEIMFATTRSRNYEQKNLENVQIEERAKTWCFPPDYTSLNTHVHVHKCSFNSYINYTVCDWPSNLRPLRIFLMNTC